MNKLMGFLELRNLGIPTVEWEEYNRNTELSDNYLWTVRSAVFRGDDLNLPRLVGKTADEAKMFADKLVNRLRGNGIVIYYPYFVAEKSGTLNIFQNKIIIEAVNKDLWNLVTYSDREVSIIYERGFKYVDGNESFIREDEETQLLKQVPYIRRRFYDELIEGKSILLEWSFAYNCNRFNDIIGEKYLVFYEARTV